MTQSAARKFLYLLQDTSPPCTDVEAELFFPIGYGEEHTLQIRQAKKVCQKCPLVFDCLEFALETDDQHAILAAATPAERNTIRDRRIQQEERRQAA